MKTIVTSISVCLLIATLLNSATAQSPKADAAVPTAQAALDVENGLAKAIRENDADAIPTYLSDDWAVVSAQGGLGEGKSVFSDGIKSGHLTRKTFEISAPRVRMFGNMALITTKVATSGVFGGKPFDVHERQTDVWIWMDGKWKCVLTHEAMIPDKDKK